MKATVGVVRTDRWVLRVGTYLVVDVLFPPFWRDVSLEMFCELHFGGDQMMSGAWAGREPVTT